MPITVKSTGGGSVTLTAPVTGSDLTLTMPSISGTIYATTGGVIPVSEGGTGSSTLTANNVLLGNGTSALQVVAPGTNGNVLTSNGTTWASAALPAGGVTSLTAGNGITVSASTGAVTVSQDIYTGSTQLNTSYPIGTTVNALDQDGCVTTFQNTSRALYVQSGNAFFAFRTTGTPAGSALTGTWRARGQSQGNYYIFQRTA
jgi:hypothetical protein